MFRDITPVILVLNDCYWLPYTLESLRGRSKRYVIYDAGSKDGTLDIIDWFTETEDAEFFVRKLPLCTPDVQGTFRNSMIAEAQTDWYFIVDADEVYSANAMNELEVEFNLLTQRRTEDVVYGVVLRKEMGTNLKSCYNVQRSHHRLYHRTAIFKGTHPGEEVVIKQCPRTEYYINSVLCYHFHNTLRSTLESDVPRRIKRKSQKTYHPGELVSMDLLKEMPMLSKPINNFTVNPELAKLQDAIS